MDDSNKQVNFQWLKVEAHFYRWARAHGMWASGIIAIAIPEVFQVKSWPRVTEQRKPVGEGREGGKLLWDAHNNRSILRETKCQRNGEKDRLEGFLKKGEITLELKKLHLWGRPNRFYQFSGSFMAKMAWVYTIKKASSHLSSDLVAAYRSEAKTQVGSREFWHVVTYADWQTDRLLCIFIK